MTIQAGNILFRPNQQQEFMQKNKLFILIRIT